MHFIKVLKVYMGMLNTVFQALALCMSEQKTCYGNAHQH